MTLAEFLVLLEHLPITGKVKVRTYGRDEVYNEDVTAVDLVVYSDANGVSHEIVIFA